jgi:hypothetical protein
MKNMFVVVFVAKIAKIESEMEKEVDGRAMFPVSSQCNSENNLEGGSGICWIDRVFSFRRAILLANFSSWRLNG